MQNNDQQLHAAMEKGRKTLAERARIRAAISTAEREAETSQQQLSEAFDALATIEASLALHIDGEPVPDSKGVRKRVQAAREAVESTQARLDGLRRHLANETPNLPVIESSLQAALDATRHAVMETYQRKYLAAAEELRCVLREGAALTNAFGDSQFSMLVLNRAVLPHPTSLDNLLAMVNREGGNLPIWYESPELRKLYEQLSAPGILVKQLRVEVEGERDA